MKQTAVEWLWEQIQKDQYADALTPLEWIKVIEQAKEMEKQQIIDTYNQGLSNGGMDYKKFNNAIHYFFETYGSSK